MTWGDWFFPIVGVVAIWLIHRSWRWKQALDRRPVDVHPPAVQDSPVDRRPALASSLRGPAAKGFNGQQGDRRAHVTHMQRRREHERN